MGSPLFLGGCISVTVASTTLDIAMEHNRGGNAASDRFADAYTWSF